LNNTTYGGTDYISVPYNISTNTVTVEIVASFNPTSNWATIWGNEVYNTGRGYMAYMVTSTGITYGKPNSNSTETISGSLRVSGSATLNNNNLVSSPNLTSIQTITSASYAALAPVSGTLYIIIG
jgi:hypothetical protein